MSIFERCQQQLVEDCKLDWIEFTEIWSAPVENRVVAQSKCGWRTSNGFGWEMIEYWKTCKYFIRRMRETVCQIYSQNSNDDADWFSLLFSKFYFQHIPVHRQPFIQDNNNVSMCKIIRSFQADQQIIATEELPNINFIFAKNWRKTLQGEHKSCGKRSENNGKIKKILPNKNVKLWKNVNSITRWYAHWSVFCVNR